MRNFFLFAFLLTANLAFSQTEISWEHLEDVEFTDLFVDEIEEFVAYPHFGPTVLALSGVEVTLRGYILALEPQAGRYILSKGPLSSCFFCGVGGPETVVQLNLKSDEQHFMMDEVVTIKGTLKLNTDDVYQCVYILDYAEVYRK